MTKLRSNIKLALHVFRIFTPTLICVSYSLVTQRSCWKELLLRGYVLISRSSRKSWLELDTRFAMKLLYRYLIHARFLLFHKTNFTFHGRHMWHKKPDLYPSFIGFNTIHLKFRKNIEITIPKTRMFSFFRFWHFWRVNDVTEFPPNFVFVSWDI